LPNAMAQEVTFWSYLPVESNCTEFCIHQSHVSAVCSLHSKFYDQSYLVASPSIYRPDLLILKNPFKSCNLDTWFLQHKSLCDHWLPHHTSPFLITIHIFYILLY
jgi:hypothetical protein